MKPSELGFQVQKQRARLHLSQEELAARAELSRNYISLIERGEAQNVSVAILNRLAGALQTTPAELLHTSENNEILIPPSLRELGKRRNLSFDAVDRLVRIPHRGQEPKTVEEWEKLYNAVRKYLK